MITSTGTATFSIYFTTTGSKTIIATSSSVTASINVVVPDENLQIITISPTPTTSLTAFSVSVGVYDNDSQLLETVRGPYLIVLTLTPTGTIFGTSSVNTASGIASFSSLRILSAGTFTITASSSGITSATSTFFTVINYVYTVTITSSISRPSANFNFGVTVLLLGEDTNAYTSSATIILTAGSNTISGILSATTSSGTATLSVYFTTTGSKTITATCNTITGSVTVTVLTDILKIESLSPTVINI